jgi:ABC-type lipoprotein export system ATPase subunit
MIRVRDMFKSYRTGKLVNEVLRGIDLDVDDGEFLSIVGPSGSGKTTLLHAIGGLDTDYTGKVEVDGKDLHELPDTGLSSYRNRFVGFVFQSFYLLPHLTCMENVILPALFARGDGVLPDDAAHGRAREVLAHVGLEDRAGDRPTTLSGGQRQRIAIARALFNRPRLMLCDEPTGNLDTKTGAQIVELFRRLNKDAGITVLIVTHDPRISQATDRTIRVEDGQLFDEPRGGFRREPPEVPTAVDAPTEAGAAGKQGAAR